MLNDVAFSQQRRTRHKVGEALRLDATALAPCKVQLLLLTLLLGLSSRQNRLFGAVVVDKFAQAACHAVDHVLEFLMALFAALLAAVYRGISTTPVPYLKFSPWSFLVALVAHLALVCPRVPPVLFAALRFVDLLTLSTFPCRVPVGVGVEIGSLLRGHE
jgi:hypothetical protein